MSIDNVNDQESLQYWSKLLHSFADSDPKDDLPEINNPILVMSTSMAIDVPPEPWNARGAKDKQSDGDKQADGNKNINEDSTKKLVVGAKEEWKNRGKRPHSNESRNMAEKRRRTDIRTKIQKLKQMTPSCTKKDISSTLDSIIDYIQTMKVYIESQSVGPMIPLGMRMDFPAPWFPLIPPNVIMPFNDHTSQPSRDDQHTEPVTTQNLQELNNQSQTSKELKKSLASVNGPKR